MRVIYVKEMPFVILNSQRT